MSDQKAKDPVQERENAQKFVQFIMVQAQNILYVLGKIPGPDGASPPPNLEAAKMLIDQLEIIEIKTEGNLSPQESQILSDTLQEIRMAFVEASGGTPASMMPDRGPRVDLDQAAPEANQEAPKEEAPAPAPKPAEEPTSSTDTPPKPDDKEKKFFKSYG